MVDPADVWLPDVMLYESTDPKKSGGRNSYDTKIILYANGLHSWMSPATFTSTCEIKIEYFPFDRQQCKMKFGSFFWDITRLNIDEDNRDVICSDTYVPSTEWVVENVQKEKNHVTYACCPYPFSDITFVLKLRRKPSFYVFNIIVPCIVLALTILFGFFFPPESGERIGLTITILLAIAVLIQVTTIQVFIMRKFAMFLVQNVLYFLAFFDTKTFVRYMTFLTI